jgi:citrate synthase
MQIGKSGKAETGICQAFADRVEVRGLDLVRDVMGHSTFTDYFHLLMTGRPATAEQRFFLDLLLVAIAEHGMMPTNVAARMTLAADPSSIHGAVAAGILGCGPVILGTTENCAALLVKLRDSKKSVETEIAALRDAGAKIPGFGHPVHKPVDPRAVRIMELARECNLSGVHIDLARQVDDAMRKLSPKPLPMNVSMPIAAVLLDLGFPPSMTKAIPILARTASLLAHLSEEQKTPVGFLMAGKAEAAVAYVPPSRDDTP